MDEYEDWEINNAVYGCKAAIEAIEKGYLAKDWKTVRLYLPALEYYAAMIRGRLPYRGAGKDSRLRLDLVTNDKLFEAAMTELEG